MFGLKKNLQLLVSSLFLGFIVVMLYIISCIEMKRKEKRERPVYLNFVCLLFLFSWVRSPTTKVVP